MIISKNPVISVVFLQNYIIILISENCISYTMYYITKLRKLKQKSFREY